MQTRNIQFKDPYSDHLVNATLLLEYSMIFPNQSFDIIDELKCFSRDTLINLIIKLSRDCGKWLISDMKVKPFFYTKSQYSIERIKKTLSYIEQNRYSQDNFAYASEKTLLELLKLVFSIKADEEQSIYPDYIAEAKIFDLLLAINEQKISPFIKSNSNSYNFARSLFVPLYASNEFSNLNENLALPEQIYYAKTFFDFITSRKEYSKIYKRFLEKFEINSWEEYFTTLIFLSTYAIEKGTGIVDINKYDPTELINRSVLNHISIHKNDCIDSDLNRDFSIFRSAPLIKMSDSEYLIYNKQILMNRLYNGLYFDLLQEKDLTYNNKAFSQFYKESFVEKYLFDQSMFGCIDRNRFSVCFPSLEDITKSDFVDIKEENSQPDFYLREDSDVFIFECKAIKLNGDLKSHPNEDTIMEELSNKLLSKKRKGHCNNGMELSNPKPEGIGQLINHINSLENSTFKWDKINPSSLIYYPILVLESDEIVQTPLNEIINEWYNKEVDSKIVIKHKCMPLILMTIKTLFLYDKLFKEKGFKYYFDNYIKDCLQMDNSKATAYMSPFVSFDTWMNDNVDSCKGDYFANVFTELNIFDKIKGKYPQRVY